MVHLFPSCTVPLSMYLSFLHSISAIGQLSKTKPRCIASYGGQQFQDSGAFILVRTLLFHDPVKDGQKRLREQEEAEPSLSCVLSQENSFNPFMNAESLWIYQCLQALLCNTAARAIKYQHELLGADVQCIVLYTLPPLTCILPYTLYFLCLSPNSPPSRVISEGQSPGRVSPNFHH